MNNTTIINDYETEQAKWAAWTILRPDTDGSTRTTASLILERYARTDRAWHSFCQWLLLGVASSSENMMDNHTNNDENNNNNNNTSTEDQIRMQLLVLQLLQSKIRREITSTAVVNPTISSMVQSTLSTYLSYQYQLQPSQQPTVLDSNPSNKFDTGIAEACIRPACICMAAWAVRTGGLEQLITSLTTSVLATDRIHESLMIAISTRVRLLAEIPLEIELFYPSSATTSTTLVRITHVLAPFLPAVLTFIIHTLQIHVQSIVDASRNDPHPHRLGLYSVVALQQWIRVGSIPLSYIYEYENGTLWKLLIHLLSSTTSSSPSNEEERIYVETARALEYAVQIVSDSGTPSRQAAFASLFDPLPPTTMITAETDRGASTNNPSSSCSSCLSIAIHTATRNGWDDAVVALASFTSTFVTEDIDEIVSQSAEPILHLLFLLQSHPIVAARIAILECWLTVSEIPVQERHEHWREPLFEKIATKLLETIQYTTTDIIDEEEMDDYRNMVVDVLLVCYYLLRSSYVNFLTTSVMSSTNFLAAKAEAALFCLAAIAPEVNSRVKTATTMMHNGAALDKDTVSIHTECQTTIQCLLPVAQHVCQTQNQQQTNPLQNHKLTVGRVRFLGTYAATWSVSCSAEDILQLLIFLQQLVAAIMSDHTDRSNMVCNEDDGRNAILLESANAVKSILIGCSEKLSNRHSFHEVLNCLQPLMEIILNTDCEEPMCAVAEGCTRFIVDSKSDDIAKRRALHAFFGFVVTKGNAVINQLHNGPSGASTLNMIVGMSTQQKFLLESLDHYLKILDVMISFIDVPTESMIPHLMEDVMNTVWGFIDGIAHSSLATETIFAKILHIKQLLLRISPDLVAPFFNQTIENVTKIFQAHHYSSCLQYISVAVETTGSSYAESFRDLLDHVANTVFEVLRQKGIPDNNELIQAFFHMNQRCFVNSPTVLIQCSNFGTIVASAVQCLEACRGECNATLAILNFVTQLFGWRFLHASNEVTAQLHDAAQMLDQQLSSHGLRTIQFCVTTLLGGTQALLPACTDCIFTLSATTVHWPVPENLGVSVARQWIETACSKSNPGMPHVNNTMIDALLELAKSGSMSKPKAKMLLSDFCSVHKGEMSAEILGRYHA